MICSISWLPIVANWCRSLSIRCIPGENMGTQRDSPSFNIWELTNTIPGSKKMNEECSPKLNHLVTFTVSIEDFPATPTMLRMESQVARSNTNEIKEAMAIPHFPNTRRFCLKIWDPILCLILILSQKWRQIVIPLHSSTNPTSSPSLFQALKWNCVRLLWLLLRNPCCHARDINCISPEPAALQAAQGPAAVADIWRCPNAGWPKRFEIKSSAASAVWLKLTSACYVLSGGIYHQNAYRLIFWSRNVPRSFCHHSRLRTAGASCTNLSALASLVPLELALQTFSAWPSKRLSFWMFLNAKIHKYQQKEKVMAWWMMFLDGLDGYLGRRLASGGLLALLGQTEVQNSKSIPWPIRELTWRGAPHLLPKSTGHQSVLFFSSSSAVGTSQSQSSLNLSIKELPLKTVKAMHATLPLSCCGTQLEPQLSSPWAQHKIYSTILRCLWLVTGENVAMYQSCTGWPPTLNLATGNSIWAAAKPLGILSHPPLWLVDKFSATLQKQPFSVLCVMPKYVISNLAPFVWMVYSVLHVFVDSN